MASVPRSNHIQLVAAGWSSVSRASLSKLAGQLDSLWWPHANQVSRGQAVSWCDVAGQGFFAQGLGL